jgi:hypothetical protein
MPNATSAKLFRFINWQNKNNILMAQLSNNWLTENLIDLEYKQYILLAYLENIGEQFNRKLLYPSLSELIEHYRSLQEFKQEISGLQQAFPEKLSTVDLKELKLKYEKVVQNDSIMDELEKIVQFSIPQMELKLTLGKEVYHFVEEHVKIEPVGLVPLYLEEGYMLIEIPKKSETLVYEYGLKFFTQSHNTFRSLSTKYITSISNKGFKTPESIKLELIKTRPVMPNPATYFLNSSLEMPFEEAFFPVAKRMLMKEIAKDCPRA